ncbi:uncharacterized protein LOC128219393 [Mya arenaria]|uniref:uncharacterized protein LOC128219393 n=1 Tax=Mya arenaria TaxID=6604 RepID=UPI0022DFF420|nr:uncharacterized protein LOC128219393 [Mya arenaria]
MLPVYFQESVDTFSTCMDSVDQNDGGTPKVKKDKNDGRLYKFVKKHILQRKGLSNDVKEIHIVPDGDEFKWARRSGGSAASRSSTGTSGSEGDRLEVVHDMAEEYTQEAV